MTKSKTPPESSAGDLGGFLGGLTNLIEKLGDLAEKGKELQETKQFGGSRGYPGGLRLSHSDRDRRGAEWWGQGRAIRQCP